MGKRAWRVRRGGFVCAERFAEVAVVVAVVVVVVGRLERDERREVKVVFDVGRETEVCGIWGRKGGEYGGRI